MPLPITRRTALKAVAAGAAAAAVALAPADAEARVTKDGGVSGQMTGARALVEALLAEGVSCVFGIPGRAGERTVGRDEEPRPRLPARHP